MATYSCTTQNKCEMLLSLMCIPICYEITRHSQPVIFRENTMLNTSLTGPYSLLGILHWLLHSNTLYDMFIILVLYITNVRKCYVDWMIRLQRQVSPLIYPVYG